MRTDLTPEQIENYQQDGVLFYRQLLSSEEVAELKAAVLAAVDSMGARKIAGKDANDWEQGDGYYDNVFTQRLNLWRINETVKRYMLSSAIGRMICELEGQKAFRVWHDQALIKEPYGNPTAWHLDCPYWSFQSRHSISIWIALEEATAYNGCMCFLPGSYRHATFDNVPISENMAGLFEIYPQMREIETAAFPMKPGDCSFHNGLTAHGAGANMTNTRRIAMTCAYMPDGSTFAGNANILPKAYLETLEIGDVLDNDDLNPVVFREST